MKKVTRIIMLLAVLTFMLMPATAFAKSNNPYKDVTHKTVDATSYDAIVYIKQHHGWSGIARKGRLHPNRTITRRQFLMILHNLYGDKVTAGIWDVRAANSKITINWACQRMVELAKALGLTITWNGANTVMKIKDAARYIRIFATYNPAFTPKR